MFFKSKKKRMQQYLDSHRENLSVFDEFVTEYLNGALQSFFIEQGVTKIEIHVDWFDDFKCLELQGFLNKNCIDLQIYEKQFGLAADPDEPDISDWYELLSKEYVYDICKESLTKASQ